MSTPGFRLSRGSTWCLRGFVALVLAFVYVPLAVVVINSFNSDQTFSWPPRGFTLEWWRRAKDSTGLIDALQQSVIVGAGGDGDRAGARHPRGLRLAAQPVLRAARRSRC